MVKDEPGDEAPELAAVLPLPIRTEDEPPSPAELAAAMGGDSERLAAAMAADPATAAMRRAFGLPSRPGDAT
jgi:hypothetical protein